MQPRICDLIKVKAPEKEYGYLRASGATVPTDGDAGYRTGCVFHHTDGGSGTAFYINEGDETACDFNAIAGGAGGTTLDSLTDISGALAYTAGKVLVADGDSYEEVTISGDATLASTGALTLAADSVETAMITDASVTLAKLKTLAEDKIIIGSATGNLEVALSGDALLNDDGVITIATGAIEVEMIEPLTSGYFVLGSAGGNVAATMSGDATMSSSGVVTVTLGASVTPGTVTASKPVVVDASKNIATFGTIGAATVTAANDDTTDGVVNALVVGHSSSDNNATAGDGVGISLKLENATGTSTYEEWASIDAISTTITDGSEDGDIVVSTMLAGTVTEALRVDASDQSLTVGRNATDANGLDKVRVYPLTTAKGSFTIQAADNTDDNGVILTHAANDTGAKTVTLPALTGYAALSTAALTLAEVDVLDAVTPGTVAASKAVVVDGSLDIGDFNNLDCVNLDAGASGTAGTVDVYPTTAAKGKLTIQCADNTDDNGVILTNAANDTSTKTITLPALSGYAALSTAALSLAEVDVLDGVTAGTVTASKAAVVDASRDLATLRNVTSDGAVSLTAGAATPAVVARIGATATEGLEIKVYDETITLTNAVFTNTTLAVPAGAVILSAQVNLEDAITGDGTGDNLFALVGLGVSGGDEDKYGNTSAITKNAKIDTVPDWAVNAGETIALFALQADGNTASTEKFTGSEDVRVRVVYAVCNSLDDAA